jgi:site-specific recombinase XerD
MKTNDFTSYLKKRQFSHSTLNTSKRVISLYMEWVATEQLEPEEITYQELLGFMKHCSRKGVSQRTIQHYMNTIKHYYNHLEEENKIATNPVSSIEVKGVKRKVLYRIVAPHELHALYNQHPSEALKERRNKVMLGLLVYQGMKTEELARLMVKDIKLREGKIDIPGSRKNNGRILPLESHQVMDMYDYVLQTRPEILKQVPKRKSQQKQETDRLFINEGGSYKHFSNMMTQLMIRVRKINPQVKNAKQIRTSVITKWLKTHNLREVQYLAGHRYISSTEGYLQNDMEGLKEEINQFHPLG